MSESRVARITKMGSYYDEARQAIDDFNRAFGNLLGAQKHIKKLADYYAGGQWRKDFEADEAGKLPVDLKRGVLSEDAINDLLDDNKEIFGVFGSNRLKF